MGNYRYNANIEIRKCTDKRSGLPDLAITIGNINDDNYGSIFCRQSTVCGMTVELYNAGKLNRLSYGLVEPIMTSNDLEILTEINISPDNQIYQKIEDYNIKNFDPEKFNELIILDLHEYFDKVRRKLMEYEGISEYSKCEEYGISESIGHLISDNSAHKLYIMCPVD